MAKVLFIEDDAGWQKTIRKLLETAGHESHYASTIDSALAHLSNKKPFDVITFDLRLGEKIPNDNIFLWLSAFVDGMERRKIKIPPIVILTGIDISKDEVIQVFTEHHHYVTNLFEKQRLDPQKFLSCIRNAENLQFPSPYKPRSLMHQLIFTIIVLIIMIITFALLLWIVRQVPDPETQRTIVQVGGVVVVIATIFVAGFSQNTKIENIIESVIKGWRG